MKNKNIERRNNPELKTVREDWKGNIIVNGRFCNDSAVAKSPILNALKWKLGTNPQKDEKRRDTFRPEMVHIRGFNRLGNWILWLGHSSFFISVNGVRIITDPCFGNLPIAKRKVELPCAIDSLTDIDYMLISHDHRDHLEMKTVRLLAEKNPTMKFLAPLGAKRLLDFVEVEEAGWWQEYRTTHDIRIYFLPARHWGRRGLCDYNKVLWGSFLIVAGDIKIFFAGDSAYRSDMYRNIHSLFGNMDFCLLPIGAYSPAWMMAGEHMNPEEAFRAFHDLGGKTLVPMHYGTYDLSDEPMGEPIRRLRKVAADNEESDRIMELPVGKVYNL